MTELKTFDFEDDEEVCIKIRGMPYRATDEEVYDFFRDYKIKPESMQWGVNPDDDRKNGWGAVVAEDEEEAAKAIEAL